MPYKDPQKKKEYDHQRHLALRESIHEQKHEYYLAHEERIKQNSALWRQCHKQDSAAYFHQYFIDHRQEKMERNRVYFANHKGRMRQYYREYMRQWRKTPLGIIAVAREHLRSYIKQLGEWDKYLEYHRNRYYLLYVLKNPCRVCSTMENRESHHIIPRSEGGSDRLSNLEILCFEHHRASATGVHSD